MTQDADIILDGTAKFYKTGEGTLELPLSRVNQQLPYSIAAIGGTLNIEAGADATVDAATPPAACQKAAFWVNTDSVVLDGASVVRWCDVREPVATRAIGTTPTLVYAEPQYFNAAEETPPVLTTKDDRSAVFFGGHQSGKYMKWSEDIGKIQTVFFVHGLYNTFGAAIGYQTASGDGRGGLFPVWQTHTTKPFNAADLYFELREDLSPEQHAMRLKLDGRFVDASLAKQRKGFTLFGISFPAKTMSANTFFYETFAWFDQHQGGDYLSEAIVFNTALTDAEILEIERYLMKKWALPYDHFKYTYDNNGAVLPVPTGEIGASSAATVKVTVDDGEESSPLTFSGEGSVVKRGAGTLVVGPSTDRAFSGRFVLQEGAVLARDGALPPLAFRAGEKYTAAVYPAVSLGLTIEETKAAGLKLTKSAASSANIAVKDGEGWARANAIADDVKTLYVDGGVLQLEAKSAEPVYSAVGSVRASFFDPDFEKPHVFPNVDMSNPLGTSYSDTDGWRRVPNSGDNDHVANYLTLAGTLKYSSTYDLTRFPPPTGNTVLQLRGQTTVETKVTFPTGGRYELSFLGRSNYGGFTENNDHRNNYYMQVNLKFGRTTETAEKFACVLGHSGPFYRYRYLLPEVTEAGEYVLQFQLPDNGGNSMAKFFLDDVSAVLVGEQEHEIAFRIPNGDMECHTPRDSTPFRYLYMYRANLVEGWTLDKVAGMYSSVTSDDKTWPAMSVVAANIWPNGTLACNWPQFNVWDANRGSGALIFVSTGGVATTTFTAPVGTYRLRGGLSKSKLESRVESDSAANNTADSRLSAVLTLADETSIDLGTVTCNHHNMGDELWPTAFTIPSNQRVTLTITQNSKSSTLLDDLVFVKASCTATGNMLKNPSFESSVDNWTACNAPDTQSASGELPTASSPKAYGYAAPVDGNCALCLTGNGSGRYQNVDFQPGCYRLKAYLRSRADGYTWGQANVVFSLVRQGTTVTNVVLKAAPGKFIPKYARFVEFSSVFRIDEAGTYSFYVQNCSQTEASSKHQTYVDNLSIRPIVEPLQSFTVAPSLRVCVAQDAMLHLDFTNTVKVSSLRLGGALMQGTVNAMTNPEYITGPGSIKIEPTTGMMMIVR